MGPKLQNASVVEFSYLASDLFPIKEIRKRVKAILKDSNHLDILAGAVSNKLHFHEITLVPVFDISNPKHFTATKLIERELPASPDIYFGDFCRDMQRWGTLSRSVKSAFRSDKDKINSALRREYDCFGSFEPSPIVTTGCLFCFARDMVAKKLVADGMNREMNARIITHPISVSLELGQRLRNTMNALRGVRSVAVGFRPKSEHFHEYQENPECSVRPILIGRFESNPRRH